MSSRSIIATWALSKFSFRKVINLPALSPVSAARKMSSGTSSPELEVVHDTDGKEFYIQLKKGGEKHKAVLQYDYIKPDYVDLEHTVVPVEFRGHGVAAILARTAFDHFASRQIDMRPTCTYLQKFYHDNPTPEYTERVKWA